MKHLIEKAKDRYLEAKRILWLFESERFRKLYPQLLPEQKEEINKSIGNHLRLRRLMKEYSVIDLESMSTHQLRVLGKKRKVPFYYERTRESLIRELKKWQK